MEVGGSNPLTSTGRDGERETGETRRHETAMPETAGGRARGKGEGGDPGIVATP